MDKSRPLKEKFKESPAVAVAKPFVASEGKGTVNLR
jgi:hypothetical protein